MIAAWTRFDRQLDNALRPLQDFLLLGLRLWLAWIFFRSGLLKLHSWEVTRELFAYEYAVPLLSPDLAAVLATAAELCLPLLLALGLLTRPTVLALFVFNVVAAISYPDLSIAGLKDHQLWGLAFLFLFLSGGGRLAVDELVARCAAQRVA